MFSAFFSASETAFFSLSRFQVFKLKEEKEGKKLLTLLSKPSQLLISILVGNESVNVIAAALFTSILVAIYGEKGKWLTILLMTPILLIFGEIIPKTLGFTKAEKFVLLASPPLKAFIKFVSPFIWFIRKTVDILLSPLPYFSKKGVISENFLYLIEHGHKEGKIKSIEKEFITNLIKFRELTVSKAMIPKKDIFALSLDTSISELENLLKSYRFSRIPIYRKNLDNIVGILYVKDLIGFLNGRKKISNLKKIIRPPYFVQVFKKAEDLFWHMQYQRIHMAIVIDEYKKVVGLITLEDLLEELFGEIYDEYD